MIHDCLRNVPNSKKSGGARSKKKRKLFAPPERQINWLWLAKKPLIQSVGNSLIRLLQASAHRRHLQPTNMQIHTLYTMNGIFPPSPDAFQTELWSFGKLRNTFWVFGKLQIWNIVCICWRALAQLNGKFHGIFAVLGTWAGEFSDRILDQEQKGHHSSFETTHNCTVSWLLNAGMRGWGDRATISGVTAAEFKLDRVPEVNLFMVLNKQLVY